MGTGRRPATLEDRQGAAIAHVPAGSLGPDPGGGRAFFLPRRKIATFRAQIGKKPEI